MRRRKKRSRRQRSLRTLAWMTVLLALVLCFSDYGLLPVQGVGQVERRLGTGSTRIVARLGKPPVAVAPVALMYLSASEDAVLLTRSQWELSSGWRGWGRAVDRSGEGPLEVGCLLVWDSYTRGYAAYVFGHVAGAEAASLVVELGRRDALGGWTLEEPQVLAPAAWAADGVFCLTIELEPDTWLEEVWAHVRLRDADGAVLAQKRVTGDRVNVSEPFA